MTDDRNRARGWWVPSKRVPVRILDVMVLVGAVAAGVLLILTIVGFSLASSRGAALATAQEALRKDSEELAKRPTVEQFDAAEAEAASWKGKEAARAAALEKTGKELEETKASLADLQGKHADLKSAVEMSGKDKRELVGTLGDLKGKLREAERKGDAAEKRGLELGRKLEAAETELAKVEAELKAAHAAAAEKERAWAEKEESYTETVDQLREDLAARVKRIESLEREFGDIPIVPLTEDLAKIKWEEMQKDVATLKEREDRIDVLFRAKLVLAGTSTETAADRSWRRERQERQASLDREASVVYGNVTGKIRNTPDAHEENLRLLTEALRKVRDSRYEERVLKLIEKEKAYVGGGADED